MGVFRMHAHAPASVILLCRGDFRACRLRLSLRRGVSRLATCAHLTPLSFVILSTVRIAAYPVLDVVVNDEVQLFVAEAVVLG